MIEIQQSTLYKVTKLNNLTKYLICRAKGVMSPIFDGPKFNTIGQSFDFDFY